MKHKPLGTTGLRIPPIVFGATNLGNLFCELDDATKRDIIRTWLSSVSAPIVIDSAGKYGAGLSLEVIGRELEAAGVSSDAVLISNKLAWRRVPLTTPEPTFEPGAWVNIQHDAVQDISYDGILRCWREGNALLGKYRASLLSVHDPDEYLAAAKDEQDREKRFDDILGAYRALEELRSSGDAQGIGVGSKTWSTIQEIDRHCKLDWVMFANSFTIMHHPPELVDFLGSLAERGIGVINSALFHGGFLVGGNFFNYRRVDPNRDDDRQRLRWRNEFWEVCHRHGETPFDVAVAFGRSHPAVTSIALSSSRPDRIESHVSSVDRTIPKPLWDEMKSRGLIRSDYPHV